MTRPTQLRALSDMNVTQTILSASNPSRTGLSASLRCALDFIKRRRVFQGRGIAEFFAEISGSNDTPHDFGISRFGNVADEQNFLGSERFAEMGGERVF